MRILALLTILTLVLAGCMGYPPGSATPGDLVETRVVVTDAETGEILWYALTPLTVQVGTGAIAGQPAYAKANLEAQLRNFFSPLPSDLQEFLAQYETQVPVEPLQEFLRQSGHLESLGARITFLMLSGGSGLGLDFERALLGTTPGTTVAVPMGEPIGRYLPASVERHFEPVPAVAEADRSQFEQAFGPSEPGMLFEPPGSFYEYRIEAVTNTTITYRVLVEDGQRDQVPQVGAILVTHYDAASDSILQSLDADVGATFRVAPPTQFSPSTPLGLEPGWYQTVGVRGDMLEYVYSTVAVEKVLDVPVHIQITLVQLQSAPAPDSFGGRASPVLNGRADVVPNYGPFGSVAAEESDDHHDDDGHGHQH